MDVVVTSETGVNGGGMPDRRYPSPACVDIPVEASVPFESASLDTVLQTAAACKLSDVVGSMHSGAGNPSPGLVSDDPGSLTAGENH